MKAYYTKDKIVGLPILHSSDAVKVGTDQDVYRNMQFDVRKDGSLFLVSAAYVLDDGKKHIQSQFCPVFITEASAVAHMHSLSFAVGNYADLSRYRESIGDPLPPIKEGELVHE